MLQQNSSPACDACDAMFAAGDPTASDLVHVRSRLKTESANLLARFDTIKANLDDPSLPDDEKELFVLDILKVEKELIPFTSRIDRINAILSVMKEEIAHSLLLARTAADFADPARINVEKEKLIEAASALATRIGNGLLPTAAWQTQRKYATIRSHFEDLRRSTDRDQAHELATRIITALKPELLAKVSAHAAVRAELLDAFVAAIPKS